MKMWLIGGIVVGLLGVSGYLAAVKRSAPTMPSEVVTVAAVTAPSLAPTVLTQVVDMTDIEPLLDPPAISVAEPAVAGPMLTRVGYEEAVPNVQPSADVQPIPKAND